MGMPWGWMKEMGDKIIIFSISSPQCSIVIKIGTMNLRDYLAFNARALTTMKPYEKGASGVTAGVRAALTAGPPLATLTGGP